jgi:membrane protease YdiL (CAAX protease family)
VVRVGDSGQEDRRVTPHSTPGIPGRGETTGEGPGIRGYVIAIGLGLAVLIAGTAPWIILAPLNARVRPDLPWAAIATAVFLAAYLWWLNGGGPPRSWREARRYNLRLWRLTPQVRTSAGIWSAAGMLALLGGLTGVRLLFEAVGPSAPPDLSPYPTTAFRFSVLIMGAVVSGVVEEAAFRGYLQRRLEQYGPGPAIVVTSVVFVLVHGVHGLDTLILLGAGFFVASVLYGYVAYNTGTIVPGMVIHVVADLAYTYFGLLGGDGSLLFAD